MIASTHLIAKSTTVDSLMELLRNLNDGFVQPVEDYDSEDREFQCPVCLGAEWSGHKKGCKLLGALDFLAEMMDAVETNTVEEWATIEESLFKGPIMSMGRW